MSLSRFPHFSSSRELFKALRQQGFSVVQRGPGYQVTSSDDGRFVFIHSGSITDRSGARSKNILKDLANLGFVPPAEFEQQKRVLKASAQDENRARLAAVAEGEDLVPTEAPVDTEPDPRRKHVCPACAEQRCRLCIDKELPCAFPLPLNLGRHRTTIHATPGVSDAPRPIKRPRASKVRTRVDPDVIPNVVGRRVAQLKRFRDKFVLELNDIIDPLIEEAEQLRRENQEQRKLVRDMERRVNEIYDTMTKPRTS